MKEPQLIARTTKNIPKTKKIFKTIEDLLSQAILQISEDGLHIRAADPAMVALIDLNIKPDYFSEEYSVKEPEKAGFNVHGFYDAVRKAKKGEELTIEYGERDVHQTTWGMPSQNDDDLETASGFEIKVDNDEGFWTKKGLPYLNLNEDDIPKISHMSWANKITFSGDKMKQAIDLFKSNADAMKVDVTEDGLFMEQITDNDNEEGSFESGFEDDAIEHEGDLAKSSTMISLDYVQKLFGGRMEKMADEVTIYQARDVNPEENEDDEEWLEKNNIGAFPVKFQACGEAFDLEITIAPRIEDK